MAKKSMASHVIKRTGSVLVVDPKGENTKLAIGTRKKPRKESVLVLDPWAASAGDIFYGYVRTAGKSDAEASTLVAEAMPASSLKT
jgi:type IV secretory pathway TraG/TraD family ATPase VirD4